MCHNNHLLSTAFKNLYIYNHYVPLLANRRDGLKSQINAAKTQKSLSTDDWLLMDFRRFKHLTFVFDRGG